MKEKNLIKITIGSTTAKPAINNPEINHHESSLSSAMLNGVLVNNNPFSYFFCRSPLEQNLEECAEDLSVGGLLKPNYLYWDIKREGVTPGMKLFAKARTGLEKTIYVKRYRLGTSKCLEDYAAFKILRNCGARAPKVKLNFLQHDNTKAYVFSTDIAHVSLKKKLKNPTKSYRYFSLYELPYTIDYENRILSPKTTGPTPPYNKIIPLDKTSLIRLLFLISILRLNDLHSANIGIIFSEDNAGVKAKFAVVDFAIRLSSTISDDYAISEMIIDALNMLYMSVSNARALASSFTQNDYVDAFAKINTNFLSTCNQLQQDINANSVLSMKVKDAFTMTINSWIKNFEKINLKLNYSPMVVEDSATPTPRTLSM